MQGLEMPHALTRFSVETHDGLGEQVVAGTHAAEVVARCFFKREIDVAEFFVGAQKRPRAAVTRVDIRSVEPRFFTVLSGPRNDMECPQVFAGARVEAADVVWRRF